MPKSSKRRKGNRKNRADSAYVIFISHSSNDAWIAKTIAEQIESLGAECWLDEKDLEGGNVIVDEIISGIEACKEAIVLISSNSVNSPWVSFEIGGVRAQHKRVTPILNNVHPNEMAPIQDIKAIDLNKFDEFLAQLRRRIARAHSRRKA
jgi:hypothetical protein